MVLGAIALALYGIAVCQLLMRFRWSALVATRLMLILWLGVALGGEQLLLAAQ